MDVYNGFHTVNNNWTGLTMPADSMMKEKISYDANGNILTYRRDNANGALMDNLTYKYYPHTNRLRQINDPVSDGSFPAGGSTIYDIDNQSDTSNYVYDAIGNMVQDKKEQITDIKWNVYGKITEITRTSSGSVPVTNIKYFYDALGNRIGKVFDLSGNKRYTWYVRDAQGNLLSVYDANPNGNPSLDTLNIHQVEQYLYGSSRLGMYAVSQPVDNSNAGPGSTQFYTGRQLFRGQRNYELTNHLSNVLATVTDKKFGVSSGGSLNDYYNPDIVSATDYYPFGMAARMTVNLSNYTRFAFNGKEFDWEVKAWQNQYDYGFRIYDPRIGRFLSVDPLSRKYPWNTPYSFAENDPISFIDLEGTEKGDAPYKKNNVTFVQLFSPWVSPVLRKDGETFSNTAIQKNTADKIDYTINAQQFEGSKWNALSAGKNSNFISQGLTIFYGKTITGRSSPSTFNFTLKDNKISFGQGDPPSDATFAVGGGIPVIINGLKYGAKNIYTKDAPAGLPEVGDPGEANRKYLVQRSNAGYPKQDNEMVGKTILAYNSKTNAFMIVSQPDEVKGMTLTQIRDHLISLGYDNAVSFDGSNSSTLVGDNTVITAPSTYKDNAIPSGIRFQVLQEKKK